MYPQKSVDVLEKGIKDLEAGLEGATKQFFDKVNHQLTQKKVNDEADLKRLQDSSRFLSDARNNKE